MMKDTWLIAADGRDFSPSQRYRLRQAMAAAGFVPYLLDDDNLLLWYQHPDCQIEIMLHDNAVHFLAHDTAAAERAETLKRLWLAAYPFLMEDCFI